VTNIGLSSFRSTQSEGKLTHSMELSVIVSSG
jgi:hypothetical protein